MSNNTVYTLQKVQRYLESGRLIKGAAPDNDKLISAVWTSGIWNMIYDTKYNRTLVRSFYICTVCKELVYLEQGAQGNSKLTRHPCYRSYVQKQKNEELEAIKQESKKSKKEKNQNDDSVSGSDADTDLDSNDSDSDSRVTNTKNALTYEQWSLLSRTFYKFRKVCIETAFCDVDDRINPATFYTIMPKSWDFDEW